MDLVEGKVVKEFRGEDLGEQAEGNDKEEFRTSETAPKSTVRKKMKIMFCAILKQL